MASSEQDLLRAVRAGDRVALGALLERHAPAVLRFGMKMCRDPEDAQDVLQETLLAAAKGLPDFRGDASLSTWLYAVARSFCIKKRRRSKFAPAETVPLDPEAVAAAVALPDEAAASRELGDALARAIDALEPPSREVLLLRDVEGLTAPEVAEVLGVSIASVKSRLHRARGQVRARLEPMLPAAERVGAPTPSCPEIVGLFSRYLEGEIGPSECADMDRHVASCARCRAACDSLKHTLSLCRASGEGEVTPEVQALVKAALRDLSVP